MSFETTNGVIRIPYEQLPDDIGGRYFTFEAGGRKIEGGYLNSIERGDLVFFTENGIIRVPIERAPADVQKRLGITQEYIQRLLEQRENARFGQLGTIPVRPITRVPAPQNPIIEEKKKPEAPLGPARDVSLDQVRKWLLEICLDPAVDRVRRWTVAPLVSCFGGSASEVKIFENAVSQINEAFAGCPMKLVAGTAPDKGATIHVHFCESRDVPRLNRRYGITRERSEDQTWRWWKSDDTMERAVVVIARDRVRPDDVPRVVLDGLMGSLGYYSWHADRSKDPYRGEPQAGVLSPFDKQLLAFYYTHLRPGDTRHELRRAIDEHWSKLRRGP